MINAIRQLLVLVMSTYAQLVIDFDSTKFSPNEAPANYGDLREAFLIHRRRHFRQLTCSVSVDFRFRQSSIMKRLLEVATADDRVLCTGCWSCPCQRENKPHSPFQLTITIRNSNSQCDNG
jgi:hypothetical protein